MKKVIKHGCNPKNIIRKFICRNCNCEFEASSDEYFATRYKDVYESICPECGDRSFAHPYFFTEGEKSHDC